MPTTKSVRLTLHATSDPLVWAYGLAVLWTDGNGVPHQRFVTHGRVDLQDPDPVGIEVVAALLARVAHQEA